MNDTSRFDTDVLIAGADKAVDAWIRSQSISGYVALVHEGGEATTDLRRTPRNEHRA